MEINITSVLGKRRKKRVIGERDGDGEVVRREGSVGEPGRDEGEMS